MILALAMVLGVVVGWLTGGRLHNIESLELRYSPVFLGLFLGQALLRQSFYAPDWLTPTVRVVAWCTCAVGLLVLVAVNPRVRGLFLVGIGLAMNLLVIALNGAMPLSLGAARSIGATTEDVAARLAGGFYEVVGSSTRLPALADVVPIAAPVPAMATVLSVGDILMLLGVTVVVAYGMHSSSKKLECRA